MPGIEGGITLAFAAATGPETLQRCPAIAGSCVGGVFGLHDAQGLPAQLRFGTVSCLALEGDDEAFLALREIRGDRVATHAAYARDGQARSPGPREPVDSFSIMENVSFDCQDAVLRQALRKRARTLEGHVVVLQPCELPGVFCAQ